jgi:hypothetical protein
MRPDLTLEAQITAEVEAAIDHQLLSHERA